MPESENVLIDESADVGSGEAAGARAAVLDESRSRERTSPAADRPRGWGRRPGSCCLSRWLSWFRRSAISD